MRTLTRENLLDILYGCAILGTGGGGSLDEGIRMIDEALDAGKSFRLATFEEMDPEAVIGTPYACGAISPLTEEELRKYARLKETEESFYILNMKQMERFLGREVSAVISTELGGGNTATAFYVGAMTGRPIMDGDPAGRSVPALQHSTYFLKGVPMCPMSVMNEFGEGAVFTNVFDDERGEDLVRALAVVSRNTIAVMDHVNTAAVLKDAVITGAISYAEAVGRAFRRAKESGGDYVKAVTETGKGRMMFKGTVTESGYETRDGYTFGNTVIRGSGDWEGHTLHIWYQNENIISWLDGAYFVTVPDLICIFDLEQNMPQLNPFARVGEEVGEWEDIAYYKSTQQLPVFGFTPDADFPAIYGEKGILEFELTVPLGDILSIEGGDASNMVPGWCRCTCRTPDGAVRELEVQGRSAHASTPEKGENAVSGLMAKLARLGVNSPLVDFYQTHLGEDFSGGRLGCGLEDLQSGKLTVNAGLLRTREGKAVLTLDVRNPVTFSPEDVEGPLDRACRAFGVQYMCLVDFDEDLMIRTVGRVDTRQLQIFMRRVAELTRNAKTMRVTTPAGCDVSFEIDPVHYVACDCGDATMPGIHMLTGQINVVPRFGSVQGTIVFDGSVTPPFGRSPAVPVRLTVKDGVIQSVEGGEEASAYETYLRDFQDPGMLKMAHIAYGFNPGARLTGNIVEDERVWGATEWGIGYVSDIDAPPCGQDAVSHSDGICLKSSVWLDGVQIMDRGEIVLPELAELAPKR